MPRIFSILSLILSLLLFVGGFSLHAQDATAPEVLDLQKAIGAQHTAIVFQRQADLDVGRESDNLSAAMIFLALVIQFKHAFKPLIVFAAIPYGMVGALLALGVMRSPFGFMAFLGIVSLVGVIVSHVIVLFDFIEEAHQKGEPLRQALLDAGIMRLRPVLITVGATVIALFPLAAHGGPLWEPLCYAQIGGLSVATFITLLLVPVIYAICVLDLKVVKWEAVHPTEVAEHPVEPAAKG